MSSKPLAYFITWRTYGSWLPGDERRWVKRRRGFQSPNPDLKLRALLACKEQPLVLSPRQRDIVEAAIQEHCRIRGWPLHANRCRSNHVHVVVFSPLDGRIVRQQLKARCTLGLNESACRLSEPARENWWAERGSVRKIYTEEGLEKAVIYVNETQDRQPVSRQ